ncbi:MAG: GAF domain-containing protein [Candidatus Methanogranum gryphiswaldense]|nr:MAG: GAF domain-containing protein [Candidatus Methanogranum sp. U3.2.1]
MIPYGMYGVLLISSDEVLLQQARRFITNINDSMDVHILSDPAGLNAILKSELHLDVIVCDHDPPNVNAISIFNEMSRMNDLRPFIIMTKKADGNVAIKAFELKMDYYVSRENVMNFYMDLSSKIILCAEKVKIEAYRQLSERRMNALLSMATMHDKEFGEILNYALESSVKLTNSTIGYIAMYEEDTKKLKMGSWSLGGPEKCKMKNRQITYDFDSTGVWGEPIRQKKAIIINDYSSDPRCHENELPAGHVELKRLLMIPIFHNGQILATAGVGNKSLEYTEDDTIQFTLFMEGLISIYHERMLEEENVRSERNLREVMLNAPVGIMIVDNDLSILENNEYARSLLTSHSLCLSKEPLKAFSNDLSRMISSDIDEVRESGEPREFRHSVDNNGVDVVFKINVAKTVGKKDEITGFIIIIDDITEIAHADKVLRQTMERINVLDSLMNEDIRKSLKDLRFDADGISNSLEKESILDSIGALDNIMKFVQEYHDVGLVDPQWQSLDDIIDIAVKSNHLEPNFMDRNVKGAKILADPAFYNVFSNLVMYSLIQGVRVTKCSIKCRIDNGSLVIVYSDDGVGIPYDQKASFVSGASMEYGRGAYLAFNILRASGFRSKEVGVPGRGMIIEITVPSSNYSINWE